MKAIEETRPLKMISPKCNLIQNFDIVKGRLLASSKVSDVLHEKVARPTAWI